MYRRTFNCQVHKMCILIVSSSVLDTEGAVVTDGNAASRITKFLAPQEGMQLLDFNQIFAKYCNDDAPFVKEEKT